ncbi:hypothetical protein [Streptomyces sp. NPDC054804]
MPSTGPAGRKYLGTRHPNCGSIERRDDDEDQAAGRKVRRPTLALGGEQSGLPELYEDIAGIWQRWVHNQVTAMGV